MVEKLALVLRQRSLSELPAVQWRKRMKGLWKPFKSRRERGQSAARGGEDPECTR